MNMSDYAVIPHWESRLDMLAGMAEPENWEYRAVPSRFKNPVLNHYINSVFFRALEQGLMFEGDDIACFNTGLLTKEHQYPIIAVFTIYDKYDPSSQNPASSKKWYLRGWFSSNDRILSGVPDYQFDLVSFWKDPTDLIFDPRLDVRPKLEHIIEGRVNRFPIWLGGKVDAQGVPTDLAPDEELQDEDDDALVSENQPISRRVRNALDGAISHSVRLARRSYRIAVPQFHRGRIKLLLPLYFGEQGDYPDLALTLERHDGCYIAATVLYPDWAYRHARLLARPNSEWLGGFRTDTIQAGTNRSEPLLL